MVVLTAYCTFDEGKLDAALDACRAVRSCSVLEPGCEKYDFYQSPDHPAQIVFVEEWTNRADLETHFQQPAFIHFQNAIRDLVTGTAEIRIFEAKLEQ